MRRLVLFAGFILILVISTVSAQTLPPVNPATTVGDFALAGNPSLVNVTNNIATRFSLAGYQGNILINETDTSTALNQLCSGEIDIALANRQISAQEANTCIANGGAPVAMRVATNAVIVAVARQNTFATNVTSTELQAMFGTAINWSNIRPEWPEQPIGRYGPGQLSEEFQLFATVVFGGNANRLATALGAQYNDDVNLSVARVAESPNAVGFFDARLVLDNPALLTGVSIDGVPPGIDSITSTAYPLSRPLILYTTDAILQTKPQVADFLNFYLTNVEQEIATAGLYPAPEAAFQAGVNAWASVTGNTVVPIAPPVVSTPGGSGIIQPLEPTPLPTVIVDEETSPELAAATFDVEVQNLLVNARLDLELLANELQGANRPPGWSGSLDVGNPQLPLLLRLDLELLAAQVYGIENRPERWIGAVSSTRTSISRDIRHDLELLADHVLQLTFRPATWAGADPLLRCDRSTQALVNLLIASGIYTIKVEPLAPNFCEQLARDVAVFTEVNLLERDFEFGASGVRIPRDVRIDTDIAVAYFNRSATRRAGVIPLGVDVTPIARSYVGFSNMTLIEGDNFLLFVEYQNTTLTREQWLALPNEADLQYETTCSANFC